jgi:trigger factor
MNITVTDQPQCKKQLRIEIPGDRVREETDKVAANLARQVSVPGFRPGHVPKSVVKTRFRKELRDEVLSHLLPHTLGDVIREKDLKVVGEPSIENLNFGDDESIDVTFNLEVAPEFELGNYNGLSVTKRVYKVTDEDVDRVVGRLREQHAELVPVEDRPAQSGDIVTVNLTGRMEQADEQSGDGAEAAADEPQREEKKQPDEMSQQDVEIELGAQGVLKEFTQALEGTRPGETREFSVDYPADYKPEQFAGRKFNYTAEVTAVRVKELPEVDDQFVEGLGEDVKTADELRAKVRENLEHEASHRTENELRNELMKQLVDRNRFDVPEVIVEKQIDSRMGTLIRSFAGQGIDPRRLNLDWDRLRDAQRERAASDVRGSFILERIAEKEGLEASDDDINKELEQYAETSGQEVAALRARLTKEGGVDSIKEQVRHRKALDLVIASADLKTEEVEGVGDESAGAGGGEQAGE